MKQSSRNTVLSSLDRLDVPCASDLSKIGKSVV